MSSQVAAVEFDASSVDKLLTIHKVGILPPSDNVKGLYSIYAEKNLSDLITKTHRFDLVAVEQGDTGKKFDSFENNAELVKKIGRQAKADILLAEHIVKSPSGLELTLDLFLVSDGKLFAQETHNTGKTEVSALEAGNKDLYTKILAKIPYKGLVLSRQGNRVTIDLGVKDGIAADTFLDIEQILATKRHPKFNFLLSTEKEIIGKIRIIKSDETLSFGVIVQEKKKGIITVDSKVTNPGFVNYGASEPAYAVEQQSLDPGPKKFLTKDAVSFGKNPQEWVPAKNPSLGVVGLSLGLGSLHNSLVTQNNSYSSNVSVYPQLKLDAEAWITQNWYANLALSQGIFNVPNPAGTSVPSSLGANNSSYQIGGGYKLLLDEDFFGPQLNAHTGYGNYSFFIDASSPLTFTSASYSGLFVGLGGSIPITPDRGIYLDGNLDYYLFSNLTETPASSAASSSSSITKFSLGGTFKLNPQFAVVTHLNFDFYSATFSGTGSRSDPGTNASQSLITLLTGINYSF